MALFCPEVGVTPPPSRPKVARVAASDGLWSGRSGRSEKDASMGVGSRLGGLELWEKTQSHGKATRGKTRVEVGRASHVASACVQRPCRLECGLSMGCGVLRGYARAAAANTENVSLMHDIRMATRCRELLMWILLAGAYLPDLRRQFGTGSIYVRDTSYMASDADREPQREERERACIPARDSHL